MAKIAFGKLNLTKNNDIKNVEWEGQNIEVKQYLPVEEKLNCIVNIINSAIDQNNFYNPCKLEVFYVVNVILNYAGITITDKQKEDIGKLYDLLVSSGFKDAVFAAIPQSELDYIFDGMFESVKAIYQYRNSVFGIMDGLVSDYENLGEGVQKVFEKLQDKEDLSLLRDVVTKLG